VSTAAAQLAQSIVFESGLQHYADDPVHYRARPEAVELLRAVPAAWDDVRLLAGAPRESVTLARRHGHEWFIGSLSATAERTETVSLRFLAPDRIYTARLYADGPGDTIRVSEQTVTRSSTLSVAVSRFGGYSVRLTPAA
jgi:alpha-glucosidase